MRDRRGEGRRESGKMIGEDDIKAEDWLKTWEMAIVGAISEMSATRLSVRLAAVLFVATTLVDSQVTWTPIYVGTYSEYSFPFFSSNLSV